MKLVAVTIQLPEYTQAEEDALAIELAGFPASLLATIYNSTLQKERSWNGSAFINSPVISPTIIPLATATLAGLAPATGTPSGKYLKDDLTWVTIAAGGDVAGPVVSVASQIALFDGITGKLIKADTTTGMVKATAGVISAAVGDTDYALPATVALKAPLANPAFTGTVTGVTAAMVGAPSGSGNSTGTNTGDNATNSQYSGLVSNATHTGDATGATALTVVGINGALMSGLATGILKNTTTTGVPSIAVAGDFPTLNQSTTGSAATLTTPRAINGVNFDGSGAITVTADANTLSGTVLKSTVVTSSLTSFGETPTLVTPIIGVATGTSLAVTGAVTSSGAGIGYATGAGGTVTQITSRTTTVVLNKLCGNITMFSAAQAANAIVTFTLTNSFIAATDILLVQHISATNGGAWVFSTVCGAGSATISITNSTSASITSATPLRFILIKAVTS